MKSKIAIVKFCPNFDKKISTVRYSWVKILTAFFSSFRRSRFLLDHQFFKNHFKRSIFFTQYFSWQFFCQEQENENPFYHVIYSEETIIIIIIPKGYKYWNSTVMKRERNQCVKSFSRKIAKKINKTGKLSIKNIAFQVFFLSVFLVVYPPWIHCFLLDERFVVNDEKMPKKANKIHPETKYFLSFICCKNPILENVG